MTPPSVQYKALHHRQAPVEPPNPPNDTPKWIPVVVPRTGGESAGTPTSLIVLLTVMPGILLIGLGLLLIYGLYMRHQDHASRRGGRDIERYPSTPAAPRPNGQSPDRGHELVERRDHGRAAGPARNASRGRVTEPRRPNNDLTSSTVVGPEPDIITQPRSAIRRRSSFVSRRMIPLKPPAPSPPPTPPPVIQKRRNIGTNDRDDRRGRGSLEISRSSRSRSRSTAATPNRRHIRASDPDHRRGEGSRKVVPHSQTRSRSLVRAEPSHSELPSSFVHANTTTQATSQPA